MLEKVQLHHADITRQRILKAARELFAKKGFSGTPTLKIAEKAKINEALIFHHFGNKAKLWQAVKSELAEKEVHTLNQKPSSLAAFLKEIIQQRLKIYQSDPDVLRLMQWQRLEKEKANLIGGTPYSPTAWLDPELLMLWLLGSIQPLITDDLGLFQTQEKQNAYITLLITGLETGIYLRGDSDESSNCKSGGSRTHFW